jgi:hypothetical protein
LKISRDDADFVTAARQALPALIELVEAYEMELESLRDVLSFHGIPVPGIPLHDELIQALAKIENIGEVK